MLTDDDETVSDLVGKERRSGESGNTAVPMRWTPSISALRASSTSL
jgi:hypothetical protein